VPDVPGDARHSPLIEPDKRISRIRLFGKTSPQAHAGEHSGNSSEQLQTEREEILAFIFTDSFRGTEAPLTTPPQMLPHAVQDILSLSQIPK
jgi:hypothetical protein